LQSALLVQPPQREFRQRANGHCRSASLVHANPATARGVDACAGPALGGAFCAGGVPGALGVLAGSSGPAGTFAG
jgi:hypothetical protein